MLLVSIAFCVCFRLCKALVSAYSRVLELKISVRYKMSDKSTSSKSFFSLPPSVRGMKVLDRDAFTVDASVMGLKVPTQSITAVQQRYKQWLLKVPRMQPIAELSDDDVDRRSHRLFLFSPHRVKSSDAFGEGDRTFLSKNGVVLADIQLYGIMLTYENFSYDDILDAILPGESAIGGFSIIGHIAHLNLRDNLLEYKHIIGRHWLLFVFLLFYLLFFFSVLLLSRTRYTVCPKKVSPLTFCNNNRKSAPI